MYQRKFPVFIFISLLLAPALFSQSLNDIAQKEKARRESLKNQKIAVLSNVDLMKLTKTSAIISYLPAVTAEGQQQAQAEGAPPAEQTPPVANAEAQNAANQAPDKNAELENARAEAKMIEDRYRQAKNTVQQLTLQMNALYQQLNNQNDQGTAQRLQSQITETYAALLKTQEEEAKLKVELDGALARIKK